jgi:hypothetical protein
MMTLGNMDDTVSGTEAGQSNEPGAIGTPTALEVVPEPPPPPDFDATPWPVAPRPAPRPLRVSRPWGPRLWTATLAAALLFTAGGLALLYVDDMNSQNAVNQLNSQNEALKSQTKQAQAQLLTTQTNLTATLGELATVRAELEHPQLTIWNVSQEIKGPDYYLAGGAPDTFTYHLVATSSGPMSISILTLRDFVRAIDCVQNGGGSTHYCMHHSGVPYNTWTDVTTVNYDFHAAEGCAGYVVVFTSSGDVTVKPNVSITYNPASSSTGDCA